jgi:restriction system protein
MAIPDYQTCMLPLLRFHADNKEHSLREAIEALAAEFKLTDAERREMLPSGQQEIFDNRVGWAKTYMKKAGLLEATRRGHNRITQRGTDVLKDKPPRVDVPLLEKFEEFQEFRARRARKNDLEDVADVEREETSKTPEEALDAAYQKIRSDLASEVLQRLKGCSDKFFERIVVEVLLKMGYGGNRRDAGKAIGKGHDGGLDGLIKEDRLGLDAIYIQAKRWKDTVVGRPEIQKFVGALADKQAKKGVFITTSEYSREAREYASRINDKAVVLIDGETLAQLMIDHNVGVSTNAAYELKKIDTDYFVDE